MRLPFWTRKPEARNSVAASTALVVIELPGDGMPIEQPTADLEDGSRRGAGVLARSAGAMRRLARRLNPTRVREGALGASGKTAKSVVVKLHPRRLVRAAREFRRIGASDLARIAHGLGQRSKGVARRLRVLSPRKARSVRVVAAAVRDLVQNIDPAAAARIAREATRLARKTLVKLDPRRVEAAVRRVAETIDVDGKGKMDKVAKAALAKIGPERATRIAAAATRALKRLVDRLDPDHVGQVIGHLVAAAKSANDKKGRLRVVGLLASLVREVGRSLRGVAREIEIRDVAVVVLIILATAPELLIAAGVSAAALRVLTPLIKVLVEVLPDRKDSPA